MKTLSFITTSTSITVVIDGKVYTIASGDKSFKNVKAELGKANPDPEKVLGLIHVPTAISNYSKGNVTVKDGVVYYKGCAMHNYCAQKVLEFISQGLDCQRLMRFFDRLMSNPSARAVGELYKFLEHQAMPLTEDGCFLAYKGVRNDYFSITAGAKDKVLTGVVSADGRIYNGVGEVIEVMRNYVDDDANRGCSSGLHAGSHEYSSDFGRAGRMLIVKIDPKDVVSVPNDCNCQKLRTCAYTVIAEVKHDDIMPNEFSDGPSDETKVNLSFAEILREKANAQSRDTLGRFTKS